MPTPTGRVYNNYRSPLLRTYAQQIEQIKWQDVVMRNAIRMLFWPWEIVPIRAKTIFISCWQIKKTELRLKSDLYPLGNYEYFTNYYLMKDVIWQMFEVRNDWAHSTVEVYPLDIIKKFHLYWPLTADLRSNKKGSNHSSCDVNCPQISRHE